MPPRPGGTSTSSANDGYQGPLKAPQRFTMTGMDFGEGRFDMALTFRNMHNFTDEGGQC